MSADLFRALGVLAEAPTPQTAAVAEALDLERCPGADEFTELFVMQLAPYASMYLGPEGMMGGEARDRVAGFWRALGTVPPVEPDHLAVLLGLYAAMVEQETNALDPHRARISHARRALLWEHLLSWLPIYLRRVREIAGGPYDTWAAILDEALRREAATVDTPPELPLHFRAAGDLPNPDAQTLEEVLEALLAPVRSGMVLTKRDLTALARDLGLGLRHGERRFILKALVEQDAAAVFGWLETEAQRQRAPSNDPFADFWSGRAEGTAYLLKILRHAAADAHA